MLRSLVHRTVRHRAEKKPPSLRADGRVSNLTRARMRAPVGALVCTLCALACETEVHLGQPDAAGTGGLGGSMSGSGGSEPVSSGGSGQAGMGGEPSVGDACPDGALFCSGFEVPWNQQWSGSQVSGSAPELDLVTMPTRSGSGALRSYVDARWDNARLEFGFDEPIFSGPISIRGYFFIPSASVYTDTIIAMELNDGNSGGASKTSINFDVEESVRLVTTTGLPDSGVQSALGVYQRDVYNCAVLRVMTEAENGTIEVEINGSVVISVAGDTLPDVGWGRVLLGALSSSDEAGLEFFWDDIAVAQEELTCL